MRANKVLGINARSSIYMRGNTKLARHIADDKLATKQLMLEHDIPTARLIGVIRNRQELRSFDWESLPQSFVIKPNRGFGGEGIIVVYSRLQSGAWLSTNKKTYTVEDLTNHMYDILDGNYSLQERPDIIVIEERLSIDTLYKRFASQGLPDIRVVVYNLVPVMAMIRVPTKRSNGKANLAQGGIALGVDIATGFTTYAVQKSVMFEKQIDRHPDTNAQLRGVRLPYWSTMLRTAVQCAQAIGLKYCGVDLSVDKKLGPVVLEANARPGLGIQLANQAPLRERLDRIMGLKVKNVEHGIAIAQELFASEYAQEVKQLTGRPVIGLIEPVLITNPVGDDVRIVAKIDTGARSSSIDEAIARKLGFGHVIDALAAINPPTDVPIREARQWIKQHETQLQNAHPDLVRLSAVQSSHGVSIRAHVRCSVTLAGRTMTMEPNIFSREHLTYPMLIGDKNLSPFLIDVSKISVSPTRVKSTDSAPTTSSSSQTV